MNMPSKEEDCYYLSVDSRGKPLLPGLSGSFGLLVAVLVGTVGGRNTSGPEDNQSGSESNTERDG